MTIIVYFVSLHINILICQYIYALAAELYFVSSWGNIPRQRSRKGSALGNPGIPQDNHHPSSSCVTISQSAVFANFLSGVALFAKTSAWEPAALAQSCVL